jgi:hypothetical protein
MGTNTCKFSKMQVCEEECAHFKFFVKKIARRVHFSPHETTTQKVSSPPPQWSLPIGQFLDTVFPARWIGIGRPVAWPARLPDLTSVDFIL